MTGGSEAAITPIGLGGFSRMRALSTRNDARRRASRPFDRDRDGFVMGEGAGIVVLEELEHAARRGARIYAEVLGYGMSADGSHITAPDPSKAAAPPGPWPTPSATPGSIPTTSTTSTPTAPAPRWATWPRPSPSRRSSATHARKLSVSSTKSQLGHLLGASGGVESSSPPLALQPASCPPTINLDDPDPDCDLDYVAQRGPRAAGRHAMSNSFGFGGHNACLVSRQSTE